MTELKITGYNHGSNILKRYNSLLTFGFTTNKAMIHTYYKKHCMVCELSDKFSNDLRLTILAN